MVRTRPPLDVMRTKYRYNAPAVPGPDERSCNGFDVLTRHTIPVRRPGGCLGTLWYQPRCVMVVTRPDRRHADATLNESVAKRPRRSRCEQNHSHLELYAYTITSEHQVRLL